MPFSWTTVSPKNNQYVQRIGYTLKLIVQDDWTWDHIAGMDAGTTFLHRYLQPLTAPDGSTNLAHVMKLLHEWDNYKGNWALSEQRHKAWGVK